MSSIPCVPPVGDDTDNRHLECHLGSCTFLPKALFIDEEHLRPKEVMLPRPSFHSLELVQWVPNSDPSHMEDHGFLYPMVPFLGTPLFTWENWGRGHLWGWMRGRPASWVPLPSPWSKAASARRFTL